jgi:hypothetical protein
VQEFGECGMEESRFEGGFNFVFYVKNCFPYDFEAGKLHTGRTKAL